MFTNTETFFDRITNHTCPETLSLRSSAVISHICLWCKSLQGSLWLCTFLAVTKSCMHGYSECPIEVMALAKTHPVQYILYITFRPSLLLEMYILHCSCVLQNLVLRAGVEIEASYTLTLDSHISCGSHCWWRCVNHWLAGVLSSMGCVQRVEWEGEDGSWASGSLSPHCDVTTIGHCSVITGVQPLNSWWYISLNSTGQVVGLPRCWYTRACNDGDVVQ